MWPAWRLAGATASGGSPAKAGRSAGRGSGGCGSLDSMTTDEKAQITQQYVDAAEALAAFARGPGDDSPWRPDLAEYERLEAEHAAAHTKYRALIANWDA